MSETAGLDRVELERLARRFELAPLAGSFGRWGGPAELREIAWWGSAFGDLALTAKGHPPDGAVLREAALFNLGIVLFDRVVDEYPSRSGTLAKALSPDALRRRLLAPSGPRLACAQPDLDRIVAIFDALLSSVGSRLAAEPWRIEGLARMLGEMYDSELGRTDRLAAKTLPVRFVGALAIEPDDTCAAALFEGLSRFVALSDDWNDALSDLRSGAANHFLTPAGPASFPRRLGRFLVFAAFPARATRGIARAREDTLDAARRLGAPTERTAAALCDAIARPAASSAPP